MSSFRDLVKKVNAEKTAGTTGTSERKSSSFRDLVTKVNNGTIKVPSRLNSSQVNDWYKGVKTFSDMGYKYLTREGYKTPNTNILTSLDGYLSQADEVGHYIRANRDAFEDYEKAIQDHYDTVSYLRSLKSGIESSNKFYSDFKDEADYNFWDEHSTVENRQAWYDEQQAKIDDLGNYLDHYHTIDLWYQDYQERPWEYTEEEAAEKLAQYEKHKAYKQKYGSAEDVKREIAATEAEMRNYERGNYNENGRFYGSKDVDDNYAVTQRDDFAITSANRDYTNATQEQLWDYDMSVVAGSEALNNGGYFDDDGNIRDSKGNIVQSASAPAIEDKLGMFLQASEEERTEAYNMLSASNGNYNYTWGDLVQEGDQGSWKYLTETEIGIYYTYLGESQEKAYKFLSDMKTELNRRQTLAETGQWSEDYAEASFLEKIAMIAATIPAKFVSTATGFAEVAVNTVMGNEINPYAAAHSGMHYSQTVRGAIEKEFDKTVLIPGINFTLGDLFQVGMSRMDSALATGIFGGLGTVFLGMGAAQEEAYRQYQQGASAEQITLDAFAAGAAEVFWEYFSYGKLKEIEKVGSPGDWVKSVLIQGANEALEESATEITNLVSDSLIMGSRYGLAEMYRENEENAFLFFTDLLKQTLHSAVGGFIGGVMGGGVQATISYADTQQQYAEAGEKINDSVGGVDALKKLANEVAGVSDPKMQKSLNKQVASVEKKASNRKVGKLYESLGEAYNAQNKADIVTILEMNKFSSETANTIADAVVALASGNLTEQQAGILEMYKDNEHVQGVINSYDYDERSSIGKRNRAMHQFEYGVAFSAAAKKYAEKTFTPEGKYAVSSDGEAKALVTEEVDGKTITKDTGEIIDIKGVKEVRKTKVNGKTKVELILDIGDGKEINAENVSYANKNDALIYEAVANLGDNIDAATANKLISKFDGGNAMVFARGITQAYTYGFYGLDRSEMKGKHTLSAELTEAQRNFAYGLGEKYRPVKDAKAKAEATVTKAPGEKGVYYRDKDGKATDIRTYLKETEIGLKDVQKTAIEVMEKMSEMLGVRFNVFESWVENGERYYLNEDGEVTKGNPNGFYDTATGEIYIDLNAGQDYQGTMLFTVAHELTHFMRQWSPEQFTKIAKIVFQHGGMKGSVAKLAAVKQAKAKAKGKPISYDTAIEEVVADGMETILKDGKVLEFMEDVKKTDHEAWAKLKEWFKKLADFLKELVDAYRGHSAQTVEGAKVADFAEDLLTQIKQIWAEGAVDAGQTYQMAIGNVKVSNDINIKEDSIDSSNTGISKQAKTGVKMQERTEFEAMPKQVFRVSTANGKAESNMLGTNKSVKELRDANFKENGFTQEEIDKVNGFIKEMADNMAKYRLKYKFVGLQNIHDAKIILNPMTGKIVLSAMVNNSDYSVNFDFTKICKKRVALQEVLETLAREKGKVTDGNVTEVNLSPSNIKRINDILASYGVETACLCCFVESKRYNIQNYYQEKVVDVWNALVDEVAPDAGYFNFADSDVDTSKIPDSEFAELEMQMKEWAGKTGKAKNVEQKMREFLADSPAARKKLRFSDLVTANGRTNLHKLYPEIESLILSKLGQSAPKSVEAFTPYNGEIDLLEATSNGDIVKYLYSIAGVRSQSFSDFMIAHVFDVLQKTASMSARKMPAHVYTKEIARAMLFGMTGEKHNMSVLHNVDPDVDSWSAGLSKDGEYNFSDYEAYKKGYSEFVQSIGWKDAVTLQNTEGYSKDCGIIGVGFSYNHMLKLHNDPEVRQVIGYHTSQMPVEVKPLTHLDKAADYTDVQNTKAFVGFAKPNYEIPEGVPSYATPPQDVMPKGNKKKTPKTTAVSDTFDIVGTFNKLSKGKTGDARTAAAKETLRQLLEYANDHGYCIKVAPGEAGKGEFDLYGDVQKTENPYLTTDHYIEYCIERGMLPMFFEFSMNPNYYKDVFDFNVFDRLSYNPETGLHEDSEGRKAYAPQTAVHMLNEDGSLAFPENFFDIVDKQMKSYNTYMQDVNAKMPSIMDEVRAVTNSTSKLSDRDKYWYPNMTKTEIAEVTSIAQNEANKTDNYLGIDSKWLYNNQKGRRFFALYSTAREKITLLYACKDGRAEYEHGLLTDIIEEEDGLYESADTGSTTIGQILSRVANAKDRQVANRSRTVGAGSNAGNAKVHSGDKRKRPSKAFLNCLENIQKVQQQYGVDDHYQFAVDRGDYATAQRMVDEASENAGFTTSGYHGSRTPGFTVVDKYSWLWLARDKFVANEYGTHTEVDNIGKPHDKNGVYAMRYNLGKNLVVYADGASWGELPVTEDEYPGVYADEETGDITTNAMAEWAERNGYDSISFVDVMDGGGSPTTVDVVFNPNRDAKSADPVTYDDNGEVIPLSQRFNRVNDDLRYSDRDSLTPDQQKHFDYNQKQKAVGSALKTLKGSVIKRSTKFGVGKEIHGEIYFHKDYAEDILPDEVLSQALHLLEENQPGFEYNCLKYNPKTGVVAFQEAPDFDSAREPVVGDYVSVNTNTGVVKTGHSNYIWHHKWNWVKNDYSGFDVAESWNWSKQWLSTLTEVSDGNGIDRWNTQLDKFGLPHEGAMFSDREQEFDSKDTSVKILPATFTKFGLKATDRVLDWGGGQYDIAKKAVEHGYPGIKFEVVDAFNRTKTHNDRILAEYEENPATVLTINNVLNVIKETEIIEDVIRESKEYLAADGVCYIKIYEGNETDGKTGNGKVTSSGWQNNQPAEWYKPFAEKYYQYVERVGDILVCSDKPIDRKTLPKVGKDVAATMREKVKGIAKAEPSMRESLYSDRDDDYMDAIKRGDMETVQRMVNEDAKAAGFPVRLFHGTSKFGFTKVDVTQSDDGISFFVSDNFDVAASYIPYYEGSEAYDRVREIGKRSKEEGKVLTARSSVDELLDFLRKRYPDQYADSHIIKENERAKYIEHYVSDAARYARELLQYSVPQNVEDLATSVIDAETDRSKWNALANSYKEFKGIHEITYNGSYFSQASDVWYTLQDRIRLLDLYANGELAIVRGIPESKETLFYHYENATQGENVGIYGLYGKEDGQLVIRGRGSNWNNIPLGEIISDFNDWWTNVKGHEPSDNGLYTRGNTRNIAEFAKYRGYRSVVFEDIYDTGHYGYQSELSTVYAYFFPQEDIKSADPITYDDNGNIIPLSQRFNTEKDDIRYSDRDYVAYDRTAILKEETVDRWLRAYATKSTPNYAQAYIAYMNPDQFLELTTSGYAAREYIESESYELDEEKFVKATSDQPLFLDIDHETGEVYGHEGRHRCVALQKAGIDSVPVLLFDTSNKYSKGDISSLLLKGQFNKYHREFVFDAIPLSYENQDRVVQNFATQSSSQRFWEKTGTKNTLRFQDRDDDSVSNRSLLANAFEGLAKTDTERNKIQEYRSKVALINEEEKKLRELNEQIKELSFAKGPRDNKKIKALRFDAAQAANRINTYDKQLLRLEASKPLQDVLNREKRRAYKKAEERGKEALADYKAKVEAKQKETTEEWRKSRKAAVAKARETAEKRDARAKLQKLVLDTVNWITYPAKTDVKCPDILKKPYADFLNGIDLSSKRQANGGDPTKNDLRLANAMSSLATALDKIMVSQDPTKDVDKVLDTGYLDLPADFVQKLRDMTESIKSMMVDGDYVVNAMTAAEVRKLSQMIRTLNHAIKTMSNLYANLRFANVEALGFDTMEFMDALGEIEKTGGMKDFVQWDNALPYYAFKRFGKGGESVFEGLMDAQDKLAYLAQEIFNFRDKTWTDNEANEWSKDTHTIDLPNGNTLTLTTADAMSIYCLSRREQGLKHLLGGGTRVMGIQEGSKKAKDSRSLLTIKDIDAINSYLTDRQKQVAEAIQEFMSTVCSDWGNEISMKRFLTKEFTEKFYFPIESNDENLPVKDPAAQQSDLFRLLNISATKPLTPGANNEVIIRNIFDVFTGHASDMARLNAYGMGLLDYMKWLNYREKSTTDEGQVTVRGVRKSMQQAYGDAAMSYVLNLVKDVNGRASDGGDPNILMKWMRAAKTASVGSSLRVATLQITSYPRAALVLSPKSLALGLSKMPQIEKAKKYCGIALWKSFGFYDTNISRSIEDQIKGVTDIKQKLIELSLKGAELGDAITWGALWNACEYEVAQTTKNKVGSDEFYQEVGKKLREVVYRTQVVDSTLTRSQIMRSKRGMAQEAAAFMSEPTLSANILMDAGFEFNAEKRRTGSAKTAWQNTSKYIGRAVAVYAIGQLTAALLEGFWDAWRDEDDEEFGKKYLDAFVENLILDLLPFNKIPIVSDVFEAALAMFDVGFYSSDKMSTTWLTQAVSAVDTWKDALSDESSVTVYNAIYKSMRALSSFFGVSASGVMREGVALWNNTAGAYDATLKILTYDRSKEELGGMLLDAIITGNVRQAESLKAKFEDEDEYESAVRKAIKDRYEAGEIDAATAEQYLVKFGGMDKDDAYWKVGEWEYETDTGEEFQKYNNFYTAVQTGKNLKAVIKEYTDNGVESKALASQITSHFKPLYKKMSNAERAAIKGYLLNAYALLGYDRTKKSKDIDKWIED